MSLAGHLAIKSHVFGEGADSLFPCLRETGRHLVGGGVLDKTGLSVGR